MNHVPMRFDTTELLRLISERCGLRRFAASMRVTDEKLFELIFGSAEFTHSEMLLAAKLLHLSNEEFARCFFTPKVQKF